MRFAGGQRRLVALLGIALLSGLVWLTLDAGRTRDVVWIILGAFALRIVLARGVKSDSVEPAA